MTNMQLGDLAQSYQLRGQNALLKREIADITQELSTGRTGDLAGAVRANLAPIAGIEHDLKRLDGYETAVSETSLLADTLQNTLERVQEESQELSNALLLAGNTYNPTIVKSASMNARESFEAMVATLGTQVAGRSLLSGVATDQPALEEAQVILSAVESAASMATTAADVADAVDAWFAPGGDYDTLAYTGSSIKLSAVAVGTNAEVALDFSADDAGIRDVLAAAALGALVAEGVLSADPAEQVELVTIAGERAISAQAGLTSMRADLGAKQAALERAEQTNSASRFALEMSRYEIISVDPYESATRLEAVQIQLESLYAITARLGRMSLVDYMR